MKHESFGIGAPVRRKEDQALLTGQGRYLGDIAKEGMLHAAVFRSPLPHARFKLKDLDGIAAMPGVMGVITADDVEHLGALPCVGNVPNADGSMPEVPEQTILPKDTVRYVGEAIAMVVAETPQAARDAVEAINATFDDLPHDVELVAASRDDAPLVWPERGTKTAFDCAAGTPMEETDAAFEKAAHKVRLELVNNRIVTNYMEPRAAIGEYDPHTQRRTLTVSSQGVHLIQPILAEFVFRADKDRIRVITPDVGGGFGTKYFTYREYALVLHAAERFRQPVRWLADRTEHFLGDYQGRDHFSVAELALDEDLNFLAIRVDTLANMGAYFAQLGPYIPVYGAAMVPGCYKTPLVSARIRGVFTNTVPVDAYRGAGRPEASYVIERLVDKAAHELGVSPKALRLKNFITPAMMPFKTPTGRTYDTGEFEAHMNAALERADSAGFDARLEASREKGLLRGIGFATYIEACAGGSSEFGKVTLAEDGSATVLVGTQSQGQGHQTAYAQLVSEHLRLPIEAISVIQGDTDLIPRGHGTGGSRSIPVAGSSVAHASAALAERLKEKAADHLEASAHDLEFADGAIRIAGTDRSISVGEVVASMPEEDRSASEDWQPPAPTFPNGTHLIELEVDPDTGVISIEKYIVVDDFGVTLNPILLEGQIHGGVAQGFGQAVTERTVYDPGSGQLLTATFMDYCMPRADDIPEIHFETRNVPSKTNALGMKGAGEAGAIGACPALVNAVVDALHRAYGITQIDMPMTSEAVWRAMQLAKNESAAA